MDYNSIIATLTPLAVVDMGFFIEDKREDCLEIDKILKILYDRDSDKLHLIISIAAHTE